MANNEWFKVENLEKEERRVRESPEKFDNSNDFYSYKLMADGKSPKDSNITSHNISIARAATIADIYAKFLPKKKHCKIADIGGGVGFLANALKKKIISEVHSYDISEDAHRYAKKEFPDVFFHTVGIHPDTILEQAPFDGIIAHEFYPFTRTSEYIYQKKYIKTFLSMLVSGGSLLLFVSNFKSFDTVLKNISDLRKDFKEYTVNVFLVPYLKIFNILHNYRLSVFFTKCIRFLSVQHYIIRFTKKEVLS